jgi:hypothetical protein
LDAAYQGPFEFDVPSQSSVKDDVVRYYSGSGKGHRRPRGEFAGCPERTRHEALWFSCEFDYPTSDRQTEVTCVSMWVDGRSTYEGSRRTLHGREIEQERASQRRQGIPVICADFWLQ